MAELDEFVAEANKHPENDYLLIQVFAGHGYHVDGYQEVLGPYFNYET
jgi:hypothetical protein